MDPPNRAGKRLAAAPAFVLTSSRTFTGAEEFSYNLKNLKRATIVGETTGGGAHPVRGERIDDRFVIRSQADMRSAHAYRTSHTFLPPMLISFLEAVSAANPAAR